jgi:L-seryl-tRNA(Ser) seleniumtransferase
LRCDKLCLAALQATVDLHLNQSGGGIPIMDLLRISEDELRARATAIARRLKNVSANVTIGRGTVKVGGGSLPKSTMPSVTIDIVPTNCSLADFAASLRNSHPPVIGHIAKECFKLDLRTIFPQQDDGVVETIRIACGSKNVFR